MEIMTLNIKDTRVALKYAYLNLISMTDEAKPKMQEHIERLENHLANLNSQRQPS